MKWIEIKELTQGIHLNKAVDPSHHLVHETCIEVEDVNEPHTTRDLRVEVLTL